MWVLFQVMREVISQKGVNLTNATKVQHAMWISSYYAKMS